MIRSSNHSSFPKIGESPMDQQLRRIQGRFERGQASAEAVQEVADGVTTVCVAEQSRAFVDIVTDGMVQWSGPLSWIARHLTGVRQGSLLRWFDTNFYDFRPRVDGALERRAPFLVSSYQVAAGVALQKPVKVVLTGPVTFARLARDRYYADLDRLADAVASALAAEAADLAAAGARIFQLDEPLLCRHPADVDRVARTAGRVFAAAGPEATTILSTYFGDLADVAHRLEELPGTHLGLDCVGDSRNRDLLQRLPDGKGVYLGVFDATTTRQEDAADVAVGLAGHREALTARDVMVGPNAGLELLPRDQAFDKLLHARYLVEKLSEEWSWG